MVDSLRLWVMATGKTFEEVEACLRRMTESGYVDVDNEPNSGVVSTSDLFEKASLVPRYR